MSWQTSLTFIETPKNHPVIAALRQRMLEGEGFAALLAPALPPGIAADFETMAQVMPPHRALTLSLRLHQLYIENRIRDTFCFMCTPIRIFIRERKEKE